MSGTKVRMRWAGWPGMILLIGGAPHADRQTLLLGASLSVSASAQQYARIKVAPEPLSTYQLCPCKIALFVLCILVLSTSTHRKLSLNALSGTNLHVRCMHTGPMQAHMHTYTHAHTHTHTHTHIHTHTHVHTHTRTHT